MSSNVNAAAKRRQRREARIKENFDRISAALGTTDSLKFAARNPTRVIPDVPGLFELSKAETKADKKEIEADLKMMYAEDINDEEIINEHIPRSYTPSLPSSLKLKTKLNRLINWTISNKTVQYNDLKLIKNKKNIEAVKLRRFNMKKKVFYNDILLYRKILTNFINQLKKSNKKIHLINKNLIKLNTSSTPSLSSSTSSSSSNILIDTKNNTDHDGKSSSETTSLDSDKNHYNKKHSSLSDHHHDFSLPETISVLTENMNNLVEYEEQINENNIKLKNNKSKNEIILSINDFSSTSNEFISSLLNNNKEKSSDLLVDSSLIIKKEVTEKEGDIEGETITVNSSLGSTTSSIATTSESSFVHSPSPLTSTSTTPLPTSSEIFTPTLLSSAESSTKLLSNIKDLLQSNERSENNNNNVELFFNPSFNNYFNNNFSLNNFEFDKKNTHLSNNYIEKIFNIMDIENVSELNTNTSQEYLENIAQNGVLLSSSTPSADSNNSEVTTSTRRRKNNSANNSTNNASTTSAPQTISLKSFVRERMEYNLPVLISPLSCFEDRYMGSLKFPTKFQKINEEGDKVIRQFYSLDDTYTTDEERKKRFKIETDEVMQDRSKEIYSPDPSIKISKETPVPIYRLVNPLPSYLVKAEDEVLERVHLQSLASIQEIKRKQLLREIADLKKKHDESNSVLIKAENNFTNAIAEYQREEKLREEELIKLGLI